MKNGRLWGVVLVVVGVVIAGVAALTLTSVPMWWALSIALVCLMTGATLVFVSRPRA